jgi:hypothetical protein
LSLDRGRGRMRVAITFRDQPEHERRGNEYDYSSFSRREAESLPHFIEFESPALFNHEDSCQVFSASNRALPRRSLARKRVISLAVLVFAAAEPEPNDSVS